MLSRTDLLELAIEEMAANRERYGLDATYFRKADEQLQDPDLPGSEKLVSRLFGRAVRKDDLRLLDLLSGAVELALPVIIMELGKSALDVGKGADGSTLVTAGIRLTIRLFAGLHRFVRGGVVVDPVQAQILTFLVNAGSATPTAIGRHLDMVLTPTSIMPTFTSEKVERLLHDLKEMKKPDGSIVELACPADGGRWKALV